MSIFLIKSILAVIFLLIGLIALLCMLTLMGRPNRKISATFLKKMHKASGFVSFILMLVISYFCIKYVAMAGDQLSLRAVIHGVLSLGLIIMFVLKILIVRFYKQFLKYAPVLGMLIFTFIFVVTSTSAGYYFLRAHNPKTEDFETSLPSQTISQGNNEDGRVLFVNKCNVCHYADKEETKKGPGLKNLLKKAKLPYSGRPATSENIKHQLMKPILIMPSFVNLSAQEMMDLLAYLETL